MEKDFLTKEEVQDRLKISEKTLERWMKKRVVPFVKIGKTLRFEWVKVKKALEKYEHKSAY